MRTSRDSPPLAVLRELLDGARDELLALDSNGTIVAANAAVAARLGRPHSFLVGKPFAALVALADRSNWRSALRDVGSAPAALTVALEDGDDVTATLRAIVCDGERYVAVTIAPIGGPPPPPPPPPPPMRHAFDLSGFLLRLPQAIVAVDRRGRLVLANRPARKLLEPSHVRVGADLPPDGPGGVIRALVERLTAIRAPLPPRTLELDDGRMLRVSGTPAHDDEPAILQLEDVTPEWREEQRKRDFVRNAAHQLRTPLAAITSAIEVLDAGGKTDPETLDRFLGHLRTHADRLSRLTRGLLVLARAEGGGDVRLEFVELRPLLDLLAAEAPGDRIRVDCPPSLAVLADADLVHEALAALVDNAVKYGDGAIHLRAESDDGKVSIGVFDGGQGVLPEFRSRILEPFFRAAPGGEGFGLGLAIAARALESMGGTLAVGNSDSDRGGDFVATLRAATVVQ